MSAPAQPAEGVRHVLVMGRLSLAGLAELERRVRAGGDETTVRLELLSGEGKALSWPPTPPANPIGTGQ